MGQSCDEGRCQTTGQGQCPPAPDQTPRCDTACCIGPECLERAPEQAGSTALWLDWTSLDDPASGPVWYDRSVYMRRASPSGSELRVVRRGQAQLLAGSSSKQFISVMDLGDAFDSEADFLLLFVGAQSCDELEGSDSQCVLNRAIKGVGFRLCIAAPGGASAGFRTCDQAEESVPSCKAVVAPPSECGRFELLSLRRVTPVPGAASRLELRREGRPVEMIDATTADLRAQGPLRIGGSPMRPYYGEVALVAVITGTLDEHETCVIERFVLDSLMAAGLRDDSDPLPDDCR